MNRRNDAHNCIMNKIEAANDHEFDVAAYVLHVHVEMHRRASACMPALGHEHLAASPVLLLSHELHTIIREEARSTSCRF